MEVRNFECSMKAIYHITSHHNNSYKFVNKVQFYWKYMPLYLFLYSVHDVDSGMLTCLVRALIPFPLGLEHG